DRPVVPTGGYGLPVSRNELRPGQPRFGKQMISSRRVATKPRHIEYQVDIIFQEPIRRVLRVRLKPKTWSKGGWRSKGATMASDADKRGGKYEVTRFTCHVSRPELRIVELTLNSTQQVPWHYHSNVQDTFYVVGGQLRIFLREPKEEVC